MRRNLSFDKNTFEDFIHNDGNKNKVVGNPQLLTIDVHELLFEILN